MRVLVPQQYSPNSLFYFSTHSEASSRLPFLSSDQISEPHSPSFSCSPIIYVSGHYKRANHQNHDFLHLPFVRLKIRSSSCKLSPFHSLHLVAVLLVERILLSEHALGSLVLLLQGREVSLGLS